MGSCQSSPGASSADSHPSSSSQPIIVKEKPASDETKENESIQQIDQDKPEEEKTAEADEQRQPLTSAAETGSAEGDNQTETETETPVTDEAAEAPVTESPPASPEAAEFAPTPDTEAPAAAAAVDTAASSDAQFDEEFKSTVKSVLLLLLDRLTRTMEYQRAAFQELAVGVGLSNFMELFDYLAYEKLLRENFSIPSSPAPMPADQDGKHLSQYFNLFLSLAQNGTLVSTSARDFPSRVEFTESFQSLCSSTSTQFLRWCESPHACAEVKDHFIFFSKALEFSRGDLIGNPRILYQNIDEICE